MNETIPCLLALLLLLGHVRGYLCTPCKASSRREPLPRHPEFSLKAKSSDVYVPRKACTAFPCPRSLLGRLSFNWVDDLLAQGNKRPLELRDLWIPKDQHQVLAAGRTFSEVYDDEVRKSASSSSVTSAQDNHSFWRSSVTQAVVRMYGRQFIVTGLIKAFNSAVQFVPSMLISRILRADRSTGPGLAFLLFISLCTKTVVENLYFDMVTTLAAQVRSTISAAIYHKALRIGAEARQNITMGEIVNYMQIDAARLEYVAASIHTVWDGVFQIVGYTSLLLHFLGPSVFAGIMAMMLIIPFNAICLRRLARFREENLRATDVRVKLTNEIFQGIRAIKSYNWEAPFRESLDEARARELRKIIKAANVRAILLAALSAAPSLVAVLSLTVFACLGNSLDPAKVFTSLTLFHQLRFPLTFFPLLISSLAEGKISLARLSKFLSAPEVTSYVETTMPSAQESASVWSDGAEFAWSSSSNSSNTEQRSLLRNVTMQIEEGELVAVVGPTGCGKSMLLQALLGELVHRSGRIALRGRVAYVPQQTWVPQDTLRNVVLFGQPMQWSRYQRALSVSGLRPDIEMMSSGDFTEIGERGINLSGGQKQRVSLARAVYEDADVYLLDDPLSALDNEVGAQVFRDCIQDALSSKTRVLVTHNLNVLAQVDRIILMDNDDAVDGGGCRIVDQGSFSELLARGHDLTRYTKDDPTSASSNTDINASHSTTPPSLNVIAGNPTNDSSSTTVHETHDDVHEPVQQQLDVSADCPMETVLEEKLSSGSQTSPVDSTVEPSSSTSSSSPSTEQTESDDEWLKSVAVSPSPSSQRKEGLISWQVYSSYLRESRNPLLLTLVLSSFALTNVCTVSQQWLVAAWTSDVGYVKRPLSFYLMGMSLLATGVAWFTWLRSYLGIVMGAAASRRIHARLISRILHAPLSFFEHTPVGRLLQRFSRDLDQIDQQLPASLGQWIASVLSIASALCAICLVTPRFAGVIVLVSLIYGSITNYYRPVARALKRLDSTSRAPIFSHFSETLGGLSVIRAFRRQDLFQRINAGRLDDSFSAHTALKSVDRWLSFRLEMLGNGIVLLAAWLALQSNTRAGATGLSLTNALSVTGLLNWAVRNTAETESLMSSVERVYATIADTPQEAQRIQQEIPPTAFLQQPQLQQQEDGQNPDQARSSSVSLSPLSDAELLASGWPSSGAIMFENVTMRYAAELPPVLQGVSLTLRPGEKLGIVGRTGSGKSSLFRALLRLSEVETGGRLSVDGVDLGFLGIDTVRSVMCIIPQDPVLFSGTIRHNLDPHGRRSDAELWAALHKSGLGDLVLHLPGALDYVVSEGGENFSSGQRQLLCLARALVRKSQILLLDEATSAVDYETDALLQQTIRREFGNATVLTIAHRLDSVLDADRILVLDRGQVAELAPPKTLLRRPTSLFAQLVRAQRQQQQQQHAPKRVYKKKSATK